MSAAFQHSHFLVSSVMSMHFFTAAEKVSILVLQASMSPCLISGFAVLQASSIPLAHLANPSASAAISVAPSVSFLPAQLRSDEFPPPVAWTLNRTCAKMSFLSAFF